MASCTRIDSALQAYVDGELNDGDRLILEDHVAACSQCAAKLREQQRLSAALFEAFSEVRLTQSLRRTVLENLPEMESRHSGIEDVNRRVKNPFRSWRLVARYAPAFVLVLVASLALVIFQTWPEPLAADTNIGSVTYRQGTVSASVLGTPGTAPVGLKDFVNRNTRYVTGAQGALALAVSGPTTIKADKNTDVTILDEREIRLDEGRVWFDVGKTGSNFLVSTVAGDVRVLGTVFGVEVAGERTLVTVLEGTVQVERGRNVAVLRDGFQLAVQLGKPLGKPVKVDAMAALAWADAINPNADARAFFNRAFKKKANGSEVLAEVMFRLDLRAADPDAEWSSARLVVSWMKTDVTGHCGYHVIVTDYDTRESVLKHYVDGGFFDDPSETQYEIPIPDGKIQGADVLHVRLVPDTSSGIREVPGLAVRAIEYAQ